MWLFHSSRDFCTHCVKWILTFQWPWSNFTNMNLSFLSKYILIFSTIFVSFFKLQLSELPLFYVWNSIKSANVDSIHKITTKYKFVISLSTIIIMVQECRLKYYFPESMHVPKFRPWNTGHKHWSHCCIPNICYNFILSPNNYWYNTLSTFESNTGTNELSRH